MPGPGIRARHLAAQIRSGERSAVEVTEEYLGKVEVGDRDVGAFLHVSREEALAQAHAVQDRIRSEDDAGVLAGVPVAVKDNLCTRTMPTTCGSQILKDFSPTYDATVVERLRNAGAVILGKTNLDEFAMGASTENSAYQLTRNPADLSRVPGGSSGGSAAAVASGMAPLALGSDTGGSVRQPAAFCGVTGMRPTYGRVSRYGLVAFASSLDQVGPLASDVADAQLLYEVIAGPDPRDSTCRPSRLEKTAARFRDGLEGTRIGVVQQFQQSGVSEEILRAVEHSHHLLEQAGAELVPVELPLTDFSIATYYLVVTAEASSNLSRFDGVRYGPRAEGEDLIAVYRATRGSGFGAEVKRRIMLGTFALSAGYYDAYYKKALQARNRISEELRTVFQSVDFLVGPTTPTPAFEIGEKISDPLELYLCDLFTAPAALAGIPAISIPAGTTPSGLPLGVQLQGPSDSDLDLFELAAQLEQLLEHSPPQASTSPGDL